MSDALVYVGIGLVVFLLLARILAYAARKYRRYEERKLKEEEERWHLKR